MGGEMTAPPTATAFPVQSDAQRRMESFTLTLLWDCKPSDCTVLTVQMLRIRVRKNFLSCSMMSSEMGHKVVVVIFDCFFSSRRWIKGKQTQIYLIVEEGNGPLVQCKGITTWGACEMVCWKIGDAFLLQVTCLFWYYFTNSTRKKKRLERSLFCKIISWMNWIPEWQSWKRTEDVLVSLGRWTITSGWLKTMWKHNLDIFFCHAMQGQYILDILSPYMPIGIIENRIKVLFTVF